MKSNLEVNETGVELYDGYNCITGNLDVVSITGITGVITDKTCFLEAPMVAFAGYTDVENDYNGEICKPSEKKVKICFGIFLPEDIKSSQVKCSRNGGVYSPLIYKIKFDSQESKSTKNRYEIFILEDTLPLEVNNSLEGTFATLFLVNEDPKTSRGTMTTIIKSS
jgi:hypothetical protein